MRAELAVHAHEGHVFKVSYNLMRDMVMSCGSDGTIKLWKCQEKAALHA